MIPFLTTALPHIAQRITMMKPMFAVEKFMLPISTVDRIRWLAHEQNCSHQDIVRQAIDQYQPPEKVRLATTETPTQYNHGINGKMSAMLKSLYPNIGEAA